MVYRCWRSIHEDALGKTSDPRVLKASASRRQSHQARFDALDVAVGALALKVSLRLASAKHDAHAIPADLCIEKIPLMPSAIPVGRGSSRTSAPPWSPARQSSGGLCPAFR